MLSSQLLYLAAAQRLYYMDWLRVLAILFVFFVHTSMPFSTVQNAWLIQFDQTGMAFTLFAGFTYQWVMHLFFFLAGAGTRFALASRSPRQYLAERIQRLLLPFLFGSLAFTALQRYISLTSRLQSPGPFLPFYAQVYSACLTRPSLGLLRVDCFSSHLWFLGYLFLYALLALPLFVWLHSQAGLRLTARLADFNQKPGSLWLFFLPTALIQAALRARYPQHQNWSDFLLWLAYFIFGYLFTGDRRFLRGVERQKFIALGTGLACMLTMAEFLLGRGYAEAWEIHPTFSGGYAAYQVLRSLNTWAWVLFFLGMGAWRLDFNRPLLRYSREALLPFYILHQVVIVLIAFGLMAWRPPILVKFLALSTGALAITLGLYEFPVKRLNVLRILFGMRPKPEENPLAWQTRQGMS